MISQKISRSVTPAKAGVQNILKELDSGFRRNDETGQFQTFYETINFHFSIKFSVSFQSAKLIQILRRLGF
jgi:hypothetical protein